MTKEDAEANETLPSVTVDERHKGTERNEGTSQNGHPSEGPFLAEDKRSSDRDADAGSASSSSRCPKSRDAGT